LSPQRYNLSKAGDNGIDTESYRILLEEIIIFYLVETSTSGIYIYEVPQVLKTNKFTTPTSPQPNTASAVRYTLHLSDTLLSLSSDILLSHQYPDILLDQQYPEYVMTAWVLKLEVDKSLHEKHVTPDFWVYGYKSFAVWDSLNLQPKL
ncbi:5624_t:CDS:2, partial [Funneliformis geosporum]